MKITILLILSMILYGTDFPIDQITEKTIIGKLGVPIEQNVILDGYISKPISKSGNTSIVITKVNDMPFNKELQLVLIKDHWDGQLQYKDGDKVCILGREVIQIGRGTGDIPDSDGFKNIKEKYTIPIEKDGLTPQSDWGQFEVRSKFMVKCDVKKRG